MHLSLTALVLAALAPLSALAGPLSGQRVELRALVLEAGGDAPLLSSRPITLVEGPGVELPSMHAVRAGFGDDISDIVEVSIDIGPDSILIDYADAFPATYADHHFAGYEFRIPGLTQGMIETARLDDFARLPGMSDGDLIAVPGGLRLDVAGRAVGPGTQVLIRFEAAGELGA